jgi:CelD/BcsL family acetyltransferase involved in cellulose biosynthesis
MNKYRIIDSPSKADWESFLAEFVSGNLQQSFDYGEVVKASDSHTKVIRLLAMDGNRSVGLVQARYNRRFGFGDLVHVGGVYGHGPVTAEIEDKNHVLRELVLYLEKRATKQRVTEAVIHRLGSDQLLEKLGYNLTKGFNVYKVELSKNAEDLWRNISHNKRRNIKKAQETGVEVIKSKSYDDLVSFYEMHALSGKRAGFAPHSFSYFNSFLKIFGVSDKASVFSATLDGKPVAGVFIIVQGDTAYALGAGSRDEVWHVRPNDILHWKAMEWACSERLSWYHMGLVSEPPPIENSAGWGLWRWKREWNGKLEKVCVYNKVYMRSFRKLVVTPYKRIYGTAKKIGF